MRLLFDQNLSHRLPGWLADLFPSSAHVRSQQLERASDDAIWLYAATMSFAIVSQDADFAERSRLYGAPPKVIWLRCGNSTPREVEAFLRLNTRLIVELGDDPKLACLELFRSR